MKRPRIRSQWNGHSKTEKGLLARLIRTRPGGRVKQWFGERAVRPVALILLIIGVVAGGLGYRPGHFLEDFAANISTELISIALTVLLIDHLNQQWLERREKTELRGRLLRELGSPDNGIALRAVFELHAHGWMGGDSLVEIDLVGANLSKANLRRADMRKAWLMEANLSHALLVRVNLAEADLSKADLSHANLGGVNLTKANLAFANFSGADLWGAQLAYANLRDSKFSGAQLERANLHGADMSPSNFRGAFLRDTQFRKAYLMHVDFSKADLRGADFSHADWGYGVEVTGAMYDRTTKWPAQFDPIAAGAILYDRGMN